MKALELVNLLKAFYSQYGLTEKVDLFFETDDASQILRDYKNKLDEYCSSIMRQIDTKDDRFVKMQKLINSYKEKGFVKDVRDNFELKLLTNYAPYAALDESLARIVRVVLDSEEDCFKELKKNLLILAANGSYEVIKMRFLLLIKGQEDPFRNNLAFLIPEDQ